MQKTSVQSISLSEFISSNNIVRMNRQVLISTEDHPYLMFFNNKGESVSLWFSKNEAEVVMAEGFKLTKEYIKDLFVFTTENSNGETRLKLGTDNTMSVLDLFD